MTNGYIEIEYTEFTLIYEQIRKQYKDLAMFTICSKSIDSLRYRIQMIEAQGWNSSFLVNSNDGMFHAIIIKSGDKQDVMKVNAILKLRGTSDD